MKLLSQLILLTALLSGLAFGQNLPSTKTLSAWLTAWDKDGFVKTLTADDLEVYLDGKLQKNFKLEPVNGPISICFVIDTSYQMIDPRNSNLNHISLVVPGLHNLIDAMSGNEYSVVTYAEDVSVLLEPTTDVERVKGIIDSLAKLTPRERQAKASKAIKLSHEKISASKNSRKVIFLVTNPKQNLSGNSIVPVGQLEAMVRSGDVLIFYTNILTSSDFLNDAPLTKEELFELNRRRILSQLRAISLDSRTVASIAYGLRSALPSDEVKGLWPYDLFSSRRSNFELLASMSGGRSYFPISETAEDLNEILLTFESLKNELMNQYRLTFPFSSELKKGKFYKLEVKSRRTRHTENKDRKFRTRSGFYFD